MIDYKQPFHYHSIFSKYICDYLIMRENLGIKIKSDGNILRQFDRYCEKEKINKLSLSSQLVDPWLLSKSSDKLDTHARRISILNCFAKYLRSLNIEATWVPVPGFSCTRQRYMPYIFTLKEIQSLLKNADLLAKNSNKFTNFYVEFPVILRVLYCCGLRIEEALSLKIKDLNINEKTIVVEGAKYNKSRKLPISKSLMSSLKHYLNKYKYLLGKDENGYLFPNNRNGKYAKRTFYDNFRFLLTKSNIAYLGKGKGPRVHDLRHTFAVHSLKKFIEDSNDTYVSLNVLMTYLGHSKISSTEYYLRLTNDIFPNILKATSKISKNTIPEVKAHEQ